MTEIRWTDLPVEGFVMVVMSSEEKDHLTCWSFPSEPQLSEYLRTIGRYSDDEVIALLSHFLIPSGNFGWYDRLLYELLESDRARNSEAYGRKLRQQFYKRLRSWGSADRHEGPWEGITWILDLLPHFPRPALQALDAYILCHCQQLPDACLDGLYDAAAIIRAKFVGLPQSSSDGVRYLMSLSPRHFECLIERLYARMGYHTELTPAQKDGGRDIVAVGSVTGRVEKVLIECKHYTRPVGVPYVRALLGVVSNEKVNKGILVTTSDFTQPAYGLARQNPRLELISGDHLVPMLNEYLGTQWPAHIERYVSEATRRSDKSSVSSEIE